MEITANNIMLTLAALLSLSVIVGKAGNKFGMPALLLFLAVGMIAGTDGFGIQFDSAEVAQFIGMISLSVILFFRWGGHKFQGHTPHSCSWSCACYGGGVHHHNSYWSFHLLYDSLARTRICLWLDRVDVACRNYVFN